MWSKEEIDMLAWFLHSNTIMTARTNFLDQSQTYVLMREQMHDNASLENLAPLAQRQKERMPGVSSAIGAELSARFKLTKARALSPVSGKSDNLGENPATGGVLPAKV